MLRVYTSCGLDPEGFWRITPREMAARIDGAHRRLSNEQDGRAWHAWHVAALSRAEKMPALETMFTKQKAQGEQSGEVQEIILDQLFLAWGGDPAQLAEVRAQKAGPYT